MANGIFAQFTMLTSLTEALIIQTWMYFCRHKIPIVDAFSLPSLAALIRQITRWPRCTGCRRTRCILQIPACTCLQPTPPTDRYWLQSSHLSHKSHNFHTPGCVHVKWQLHYCTMHTNPCMYFENSHWVNRIIRISGPSNLPITHLTAAAWHLFCLRFACSICF